MLTGLVHLRHYLPEAVLSTVVSALVLSHLRYCLTVYGNGTVKNLDKIQKILNFSARVISGRRKFDHISDVQRELGWLSAPDLVRCHTLMLAHKVLRHGEPEELAGLFSRCRDVRDRRTRQDDALRAPRCRTACGQRRFAYRAASLYNELPTDITDRPAASFCRALRRHMGGTAEQSGWTVPFSESECGAWVYVILCLFLLPFLCFCSVLFWLTLSITSLVLSWTAQRSFNTIQYNTVHTGFVCNFISAVCKCENGGHFRSVLFNTDRSFFTFAHWWSYIRNRSVQYIWTHLYYFLGNQWMFVYDLTSTVEVIGKAYAVSFRKYYDVYAKTYFTHISCQDTMLWNHTCWSYQLEIFIKHAPLSPKKSKKISYSWFKPFSWYFRKSRRQNETGPSATNMVKGG